MNFTALQPFGIERHGRDIMPENLISLQLLPRKAAARTKAQQRPTSVSPGRLRRQSGSAPGSQTRSRR